MKHYLTFKDDKSDKFWQIETNGKSFTVTYGKTGTTGQTQTKTLGSDALCLKEAEKLLSEKLKKGYTERASNGSGKNSSTNAWSSIVNAKSPRKAIEKLFMSIGATAATKKDLKKLCGVISEVEVEDDELRIEIDSTIISSPVYLVFSLPYTGTFHESVPSSFHAFFKITNGLSLIMDDDDFMLALNPINDEGKISHAGAWNSSYVKEGKNEDVLKYLKDIDKTVKDIVCFGEYDMCQNWYLLHPQKKNSKGEPMIVLFDHGACSMTDELSDHVLADFLVLQLTKCVFDPYGDSDDDDED